MEPLTALNITIFKNNNFLLTGQRTGRYYCWWVYKWRKNFFPFFILKKFKLCEITVLNFTMLLIITLHSSNLSTIKTLSKAWLSSWKKCKQFFSYNFMCLACNECFGDSYDFLFCFVLKWHWLNEWRAHTYTDTQRGKEK